MELNEIRKHILGNNIKHFYVFTGTEVGLRDRCINSIKEKLNLPIKYVDSYSKIKNMLLAKPLFGSNHIYVIVEDTEFLTSESFTVNPGNNYLIFNYNNIDKRSKFYNKFKDSIVNFSPLEEGDLVSRIKKEYNLSEENCKKLITLCNSDYARILLELNKLETYSRYTYPEQGSLDKAFNDLKDYFYEEPQDAIFEVIDAVLQKQQNRAFERLIHSENIGESNINILFNLYNTTKQVFQIQTANGNNLEQTTGLTSWQINRIKPKVGKYKSGELVEIMRMIQDADTGIKKGLYDEETSVRIIINKIFSKFS